MPAKIATRIRRFLFGAPRRPKIDERNTGVSFVDVLFALVVGKILDASVDGHIPVAGKAHLALAATLTVTSWVGYHNSANRSPYFLRFVNLPLIQFTIDIALVYLYWLMAVYGEKASTAGRPPVVPSAQPEAVLIFISACLYVAWDQVATQVRKDSRYRARPVEQDQPSRRSASVWLAIATFAVMCMVVGIRPHRTVPVVAFDSLLALLLLCYRFGKERRTRPDAYEPADADFTIVTIQIGDTTYRGRLNRDASAEKHEDPQGEHCGTATPS